MDKQAAKKVLKHLGILLAVGLAYYLFFTFTGLGLPCILRTVTGLKCPSCGITHMFSDLIRGDITAAYHDNIFLFFTWPFIGLLLLYGDYRNSGRRKLPRWCTAVGVVFVVLLVIWGIIRNLPVFGITWIPEGL